MASRGAKTPTRLRNGSAAGTPKAFDLDIEKTRFDRQRVGNRRRPVLGVEGVDPAMSLDASVHASGRMESIRR